MPLWPLWLLLQTQHPHIGIWKRSLYLQIGSLSFASTIAKSRTCLVASIQYILYPSHSENAKFAFLNIHLLTNYLLFISVIILDQNIDFIYLTETCQNPNNFTALKQATPHNIGICINHTILVMVVGLLCCYTLVIR